jgi:uncharacterized iron-regulated membrane protein
MPGHIALLLGIVLVVTGLALRLLWYRRRFGGTRTAVRSSVSVESTSESPVSVSSADIAAAYANLPAAARNVISLSELEAQVRAAEKSGATSTITVEDKV